MSGVKDDNDKIRAALVLGDFGNALTAVSTVGTFGIQKYAESNWLTVPNAISRYNDALMRHWLAKARGEIHDSESDITHTAHIAWNALAILELELRGETDGETRINP